MPEMDSPFEAEHVRTPKGRVAHIQVTRLHPHLAGEYLGNGERIPIGKPLCVREAARRVREMRPEPSAGEQLRLCSVCEYWAERIEEQARAFDTLAPKVRAAGLWVWRNHDGLVEFSDTPGGWFDSTKLTRQQAIELGVALLDAAGKLPPTSPALADGATRARAGRTAAVA
jgi:hypothetical protein